MEVSELWASPMKSCFSSLERCGIFLMRSLHHASSQTSEVINTSSMTCGRFSSACNNLSRCTNGARSEWSWSHRAFFDWEKCWSKSVVDIFPPWSWPVWPKKAKKTPHSNSCFPVDVTDLTPCEETSYLSCVRGYNRQFSEWKRVTENPRIALGWCLWTLRFWHVLLDQWAREAWHTVRGIGSSQLAFRNGWIND